MHFLSESRKTCQSISKWNWNLSMIDDSSEILQLFQLLVNFRSLETPSKFEFFTFLWITSNEVYCWLFTLFHVKMWRKNTTPGWDFCFYIVFFIFDHQNDLNLRLLCHFFAQLQADLTSNCVPKKLWFCISDFGRHFLPSQLGIRWTFCISEFRYP